MLHLLPGGLVCVTLTGRSICSTGDRQGLNEVGRQEEGIVGVRQLRGLGEVQMFPEVGVGSGGHSRGSGSGKNER